MIDWPIAAIAMTVVGGGVIIYCVNRTISNSTMERLDRLHARIAAVEEKLLGHTYRIQELEKKKQL